jgi:hypothetical protein
MSASKPLPPDLICMYIAQRLAMEHMLEICSRIVRIELDFPRDLANSIFV